MRHKTRVENRSYEPGELFYVHREVKEGKGKKSASTWLGPATIMCREGQNYWVAWGEHCLLCAPEHLRTARQVSEMMRLKAAMSDLKQFVRNEEGDVFEHMAVDSDNAGDTCTSKASGGF